MRHFAIAAVAAAFAATFSASFASGHTTTQPTVTIDRDCQTFPGFNGVQVTLSGFPPNTPFEGTPLFPDNGGVGPADLQTDANGEYVLPVVGSEVAGTFTVIVVWSGGTLIESVYVDCSKPGSKQDCKRGGWRRFDFRTRTLRGVGRASQ